MIAGQAGCLPLIAVSKYREHLPVLILLISALLIGIFTVRDYGESWDEADNFRYADYALQSYAYFFHPKDLQPFNTDLNTKGPAYFMAAELGAGMLTRLVPAWSQTDARHFIAFLTFVACALVIYLLAKRWISGLAAFGATTLFLTQPLLWGHAFVNPKDIPFMALFAASVLTGLNTVDAYAAGRRWWPVLLLSSILLGITASVRIVGPLAGLIVCGYGVWRLGRRTFVPVVPYALVAVLTGYVTWPYLWSNPIGHYLETVRTMSEFPFATYVLYWGHLYKAADLPRSYFPTLLSLQLTEPMLVLLAIGIVACVWLWGRKQYREPAALSLAWFLAPALLIIGWGSPIYDNGRQLYFLLPPLFLLAGIGLEKLFTLVTQPAVHAGVLLAAALPGVLLGIRLHPYEYVYYNALIGGTGGAFRKFEMDYWGTSFKEMTEYINENVPLDSRVLVFGPQQIVAHYARTDITAAIPSEDGDAGYGYALLLTRENLDQRRCKGAQTVHEIGRRGAVFAVLKSIPEGAVCR